MATDAELIAYLRYWQPPGWQVRVERLEILTAVIEERLDQLVHREYRQDITLPVTLKAWWPVSPEEETEEDLSDDDPDDQA